jgi:hypothetical protein
MHFLQHISIHLLCLKPISRLISRLSRGAQHSRSCAERACTAAGLRLGWSTFSSPSTTAGSAMTAFTPHLAVPWTACTFAWTISLALLLAARVPYFLSVLRKTSSSCLLRSRAACLRWSCRARTLLISPITPGTDIPYPDPARHGHHGIHPASGIGRIGGGSDSWASSPIPYRAYTPPSSPSFLSNHSAFAVFSAKERQKTSFAKIMW